MRYLVFLFLIAVLSCEDDVVVKPSAMLRLEYKEPSYDTIAIDCPFEFLINEEAILKMKENCWMNIHYPRMKATLYLSYREVNGNRNIDSLLYDAQKLTYDHTIKAESILEQPRIDSINSVYGMFYMINGNAATQSQFYVTDSIRHFVNGSLYFDSKPNFDSLYPAVVYLRNDIRRIMESIRWK
jgi:gliding motility-associated lipoprotein GldD